MKIDEEAVEKGFYETQEEDNWKPCLVCKGELVQERKAFFVCINCKQTYIADEEDMKT